MDDLRASCGLFSITHHRWAIALLICAAGCLPSQSRMVAKIDNSMADVRPASPSWSAPPPPPEAPLDHVPVSAPQIPDPRVPDPNAPPLILSVHSALRIAVGNSEVVRVISQANTTMSASPTGGVAGYQAAQGTSGLGLNPTQLPPQNLPFMFNSSSGGFGSQSQGGFGANGMPFVGGNGGNSANTTNSIVSNQNPTSDTTQFATIYDPAIAFADVESARGAFDPVLTTGSFWEQINNPSGLLTDGILPTATALDTSYLRTSLVKPTQSGAQIGVSFDDDYFFNRAGAPPGSINPQYQPNAEVGIVQPLLRGFGPAVNEAGILIAGTRANQSNWEFKRRVMEMVESVEAAYWQLYAAKASLAAIDRAIPLTEEIVRIEEERLQSGIAIAADVGQARSNLLQLRGQRLQSLANVEQEQMLLRNLLGLPPTDGRHISLLDDPLRSRLTPDWNMTIETAIDHRPDVVRDRLAVHEAELQVVVAKNSTLPQLNGEALARANGLGSNVGDALSSLGTGSFTDWRLGVVLQYPLGNHTAQGELRSAQLQVMRRKALLKETTHIATHQLANLMEQMDLTYQQYQTAVEQQAANASWQTGAAERFRSPTGISLLEALQDYLRAIDTSVSADQQSAQLIATYNTQLVQLQQATGTLLEDDGIYISDDPVTKAKQTVMVDLPGQSACDPLPPDPRQAAPPVEVVPTPQPLPDNITPLPQP